jgi:serine/threonine protein phosphatase 1
MTLYVIGDIHGHLDLLRAAHDRVAADRARAGTRDAALVHVGDLVDRGPDSAGVVSYLMALSSADPRVVVLKGNHDNMFALFAGPEATEDPRLRPDLRWLHPRIGGRETLQSYGINPDLRRETLRTRIREKVPASHVAFLAGLPLFHAQEGVLVVHAGIRPGVPLDRQDPADLFWIRDPFLYDTRDHGVLVVHGHTPVDRVQLHPNRLAVDTGAAYGGPLSAVAIEDGEVFVLTDAGRERVVPFP